MTDGILLEPEGERYVSCSVELKFASLMSEPYPIPFL